MELTPGGDLLWPFYCRHSSGRYDIQVLASSDGGATWAQRGATISDPVNNPQFEEPWVRRLDDDRLMMILRVDNGRTIRRCYSDDEGFTWTTPEVIFSGFGWPNWLQLSNGTIICFSRHDGPDVDPTTPTHNNINNENCYSFYRLSRDRGLTWTPEVQFTTEFYLYTALAEEAGVLHVLHAYGNRDSLNRTTMEIAHLEVP